MWHPSQGSRAEFEIEGARKAHDGAIAADPKLTQLAHDYLRDLTSMWAQVETMPMTKITLIAGAMGTIPTIVAELNALPTIVPGRATRIAHFRLNPSIETLRRIWIR